MTICVSVKCAEGIVLGTDSMRVTVVSETGSVQGGAAKVLKRYNVRKLVQVGDLPIGVYFWGVRHFVNSRPVYDVIRQYGLGSPAQTVQEVASALSGILMSEFLQADLEEETPIRLPGELIQRLKQKTNLDMNLRVSGYSHNSALPEEWGVELPEYPEPRLIAGGAQTGFDWDGTLHPFGRLLIGCDPQLFTFIGEKVDDEALKEQLTQLLRDLRYQVSFVNLTLQEAIRFVTFALRTTIDYEHFESDEEICGGPLQIAAISPEHGFQWIGKPEFGIPVNGGL